MLLMGLQAICIKEPDCRAIYAIKNGNPNEKNSQAVRRIGFIVLQPLYMI